MVKLRKISDEELWSRWQSYISAAGQIKKELDRRQNTPLLRVINKKNKASGIFNKQ